MSEAANPPGQLARLTTEISAAVDECDYLTAGELTEDLMELLEHYTPANPSALRMLLAALHDRIPRHRQSARDHMRAAIGMVPI